MTTEEMQKQIESMMLTPQEIADKLEKEYIKTMERKDQIINEANRMIFLSCTPQELFIRGVKWADNHPKDGEVYEKKCAIAIWLRDNLDRYDPSIGWTKEEFIGEFINFINKEL